MQSSLRTSSPERNDQWDNKKTRDVNLIENVKSPTGTFSRKFIRPIARKRLSTK